MIMRVMMMVMISLFNQNSGSAQTDINTDARFMGYLLGQETNMSKAADLALLAGGADTSTDTSNSGSVTLDFSQFQNFILTFTGNVTLANPTTEVIGQSGFIICIQDGTGSRTLSLGTDYETAGGAGITLSTAANSVDMIPYVVQSASNILLGKVQKAFS